MRFLYLIQVLYKLKILSPVGLYRLGAAICQYGINVMMLLKLAQSMYGHKVALVDGQETLSFHQLLFQSEQLSIMFKQTYGLTKGKKVGFLCRNHASLVKSIFAVSYTGANIYLLHTEMSQGQFNQFLADHDLDLLIYDAELLPLIEQSVYAKDKVSSHFQPTAYEKPAWQRTSASKIMLFTGGTTGKSKKVAHKPSLFNYLPPFSTLLARLQLPRYETVYIATPIYHGYGIAILFTFLALGKRVVITPGFDAAKACALIEQHKVEVVTVVPLMIRKMLNHDAAALKSLACIASGGAELNPKLVAEVFSKLGDVLYNLYGTSEAGLNVIATPQDLKNAPNTIGKPIANTRLHVLGANKERLGAGEIGQLCIKNHWSMKASSLTWIETGDVGYRDERGYYFLCGRTDDMVVSAGENVYPFELEQILVSHPFIEDVAVIGIRDEEFGQRLRAVVQRAEHAELTKQELMDWLRSRVARYQMPKEIVFVDQISYTSLGKRDKKQLR